MTTGQPTAAIRKTTLCRGCWAQMHLPVPIRGPLSLPFKVFGVTTSKMNPNLCTICERSFVRVTRAKEITKEASILFADIRGYTALSERLSPTAMTTLVRAFHDQCALAVWREDGIVNKSMGDGILAIFNFPIPIPDHARHAVDAARQIQRECAERLATLAQEFEPFDSPLGVGIGVHCGEVVIGEFSAGRSDYTAIGSVVNLAARLEGSARPGEVIVSEAVHARVPDLPGGLERRSLTLKGIGDPVPAYVLTA